MSISVVIPAYNASRFLRETLDSVLRQTLPADEILVIDDGSSDDTAAIARSYGPPVRVISRQNAKLGATRNFGTQEATGKWVAFVDADDIWKENKLQLQMEELSRHPEADLCYTGHVEFTAENGGIQLRSPFPAPPADKIREYLFRRSTFLPSSVIIRRQVLLEVGGFCTDPDIAEDWDLWMRLLHAGTKFASCPSPLLFYRIHSTSITSDLKRLLRSNLIVYRQHILPYMPPSSRAVSLTRFISQHEEGAAYILREKGDASCLATMARSILRWPFTSLHRYKVLAHMLMTRFTVGFRPKVSP